MTGLDLVHKRLDLSTLCNHHQCTDRYYPLMLGSSPHFQHDTQHGSPHLSSMPDFMTDFGTPFPAQVAELFTDDGIPSVRGSET